MERDYPMHWITRTTFYSLLLAGALAFVPWVARATSAVDGPFSLDVKPGGFDEVCLRIEAGRAIEFGFSSDGAVDFNLHYHRGREVFYPVRKSALKDLAPMRFTATETDDYCLMWENRSASAARIVGRITRPGQ